MSAIQAASPGSSPPVRGARDGSVTEVPVTGLIPARAGSTGICGNWCQCLGAHPRPCGEHVAGVLR